MKKTYLKFAPIALFAFVLTFASCKDCVECTATGIPTTEVCEDDFASEADYDDFVETWELAGGECD